MRLVKWILQRGKLFCVSMHGNRACRCGMAGSVGLQHSTRGKNLCLKVLQGPPCTAFLVLLLLQSFDKWHNARWEAACNVSTLGNEWERSHL